MAAPLPPLDDPKSGPRRGDGRFVSISPNPYIVGNPIRDPLMFFGREAEFTLIENKFRFSRAEGGLIVLCGERRSGKTSILFQIMNGRLGPDFIPVLIDMQSMAIVDEVDFLTKIAQEITAAIGPGSSGASGPDTLKFEKEIEKGTHPADTFRRFIQAILKDAPDKKLILLFDEYELFETKIEAGTLSAEVLFILANLMEGQRVFLVFTGSLNLEERNQDYWRIFLARSMYRPISFLDRQDALRLITEPVSGRVDFDEGVIEAIYRLTAGQAFYTQAVCQNLIDYLNEHRTRRATLQAVEAVTANIVSNAFPQMIFLWQTFTSDEKLCLALLGETLAGPDSFATARDMVRAIGGGRYPLQLDYARLSTAAENLFRREMLLKDHATPPGYAFKIDLWRHWIRRMHSVWQVMRELGIPSRPPRPRWQLMAAAIPVAAIVYFGGSALLNRKGPERPHGVIGGVPSGVVVDSSEVSIRVSPGTAIILRDNRRAGVGFFKEALPLGNHEFRIESEGYRDSAFTIDLASIEPESLALALTPLTGSVRIATDPPGARITIDGNPRGAGRVDGLAVPDEHVAEASLDGYVPSRLPFRVYPDSTLNVRLTLDPSVSNLLVTTTPSGAALLLNGRPAGISPATLNPGGPGRHRIQARLAGYLPFDTTLTIREGTPSPLQIVLHPVPSAFLVIRGDSLASEIRIDGRIVNEAETFNSEKQRVEAGEHTITVRLLASGRVVTRSIRVGPGEEFTFNYTQDSVTRSAP